MGGVQEICMCIYLHVPWNFAIEKPYFEYQIFMLTGFQISLKTEIPQDKRQRYSRIKKKTPTPPLDLKCFPLP